MSSFPEEVERFVLEHIASIDKLETLLLLYSLPDQALTAEETSRRVATRPEVAEQRLNALVRANVLEAVANSETHYQYRPATPALDNVVHQLAELYRVRRVSVISLIYSRTPSSIHDFSRAFQIRKEKK
jgi:hypothetical protein